MPKSRLDFWRPKLVGNHERDVRTRAALEAQGWSVLEIWECQTSTAELHALADEVKRVLVRGALPKEGGKQSK